MRYTIFLLLCCIINYACKSSYPQSKLYVMRYDYDYTIGEYKPIKKMSYSSLTNDTLIWLDFDMIHGIDKKNRIFFSLDKNEKKYYLNDTIYLYNTTHKIVGLVYNDTLMDLFAIGSPEKNFSDIYKMDTLSEEYISYYKAFYKYIEYIDEYNKAFFEAALKHYQNFPSSKEYPCHWYQPLLHTSITFRIKTYISVILVKINEK